MDAPSPVILIGTGGLTWSDVNAKDTPALWSFLRDGSTAAVSVRSVFTNTCPIDGWLSLSAGNRAAAAGHRQERRPQDHRPVPGRAGRRQRGGARLERYVKPADALKFDSTPGTLGEQLASNKQCVQAVGPGAGVGAAYTSGAVPRYASYDATALTGLLSAVPGDPGRRRLAA